MESGDLALPGLYYHHASIVVNSSLEIVVHSEDVVTLTDSSRTTIQDNNGGTSSTTIEPNDQALKLKTYQLGLLGLLMAALLLCSIIGVGVAIFQWHKGMTVLHACTSQLMLAYVHILMNVVKHCMHVHQTLKAVDTQKCLHFIAHKFQRRGSVSNAHALQHGKRVTPSSNEDINHATTEIADDKHDYNDSVVYDEITEPRMHPTAVPMQLTVNVAYQKPLNMLS
jgi:hypothetical protein